MTQFSTVYNRFLGKITDDMYMELTPEDTVKDLQRLLIDAIPGFEFPRKNLYDYTITTEDRNLRLKVARNYNLVGTILTIKALCADGSEGELKVEVVSV